MADITTFDAVKHFLTAEEGGRHRAMASGYSPLLEFGLTINGQRQYNSARMTLLDREEVNPGEDCRVRIRPLRPDLLQEVLRPNVSFDVTEGQRVVGHGVVVGVYSSVQ
jgi:translation elongation factor EF-Tu-like GTPase